MDAPDSGPDNRRGSDARGYKWADAEPGNRIAEVHGARSERRVAPLAAEIETALLEDAGTPDHLRRPEFRSAVRDWARSEAVCELLWRWLAEQDVPAVFADVATSRETEESIGKGRVERRSVSRRVTSVLEQLRRHQAHSASLRRSLGLDPLSAARVARDLSQSRFYAASTPLDRALEAIEAERRQALEAGSDDGR